MSRYDMEAAGMTDPVGSKAVPMASRRVEELGDLDPEAPRPLNNNTMIVEGVDHLDRLVYAIRLAITIAPPDFPIHYWTESDYLHQLARLEDRRRWALRGDEGLISEYEVNREIFREMEEVSFLILDGLGGATNHYRYGEVADLTYLLGRRVRDTQCFTFVVPALAALPDFYELTTFRETVAPMYEFFSL